MIAIDRRFIPYLFLAPALIVLGLTVFYPALQALYLSFTQYDLIGDPEWIGLKNFRRLLKDELFWLALRNTILYLICVVPALVCVPLGLAILVNQKLKGIQWFRVAYYTPVVISMVVAGIAWKWLYDSNGLLNQGLKAIGLPAIAWLTELPLWSVMAVTIWKGLGYYMVIYLAGLQAIPADLYEAATIDGSDGWRKHWDITLPLMKPYLILVSVISAISATKVFEEIFVMTNGGPSNQSSTIVFYVYNLAFQQLRISYGCTVGLVIFLILLCLTLLRLGTQKLAQSQAETGEMAIDRLA
ncbi:MAG: sugar ABC transporter permease [Synechococcales bacterium]|nr:sugar ABC transporter permease [Synechococcales bacterium]